MTLSPQQAFEHALDEALDRLKFAAAVERQAKAEAEEAQEALRKEQGALNRARIDLANAQIVLRRLIPGAWPEP